MQGHTPVGGHQRVTIPTTNVTEWPNSKAPILRNEEGDASDIGLYCYHAELQCGIPKVFPLGTLQTEHFSFEGYQWESGGMDLMTLAFPPRETREKFSVTISFKRW